MINDERYYILLINFEMQFSSLYILLLEKLFFPCFVIFQKLFNISHTFFVCSFFIRRRNKKANCSIVYLINLYSHFIGMKRIEFSTNYFEKEMKEISIFFEK